MPLCPQISITPVTVTSTGMTTSNTDGVYKLDTASPAFTTVQTQASNAWSAALGKNTVFYQTTAPSTSGRVAGDVWFDTDDGNRMYGFNGTSWVAYQFGTASFLNASVDLSKLADGSVSAAKLIDGSVVAGKIAASAVGTNELAANSVVAGKIAAYTITGDRIAANTITATNIAAGTITTDKLVAGTLTGFTINNGSGTFEVTSGGAVTATSGTIGGFTLSSTSLTGSSQNLRLFSTVTGGYDLIANTAIQAPTVSANTVTAISPTTVVDVTSSLKNSGVPTVSGTNNVILSASNIFQKNSVSSQRFKHDIVPIGDVPELDPRLLLQIPVRAFKYNDNYLSPTDSRFDTFVPGLIAEEVDAVYPIAVEYDGDDYSGPPLVWNEKYLIPGMLALIQQLEARITVLEGN